MEILAYWLRDMIVYNITGQEQLIINRDRKDEIFDMSCQFDKLEALDSISYLLDVKVMHRKNINMKLAVSMLESFKKEG